MKELGNGCDPEETRRRCTHSLTHSLTGSLQRLRPRKANEAYRSRCPVCHCPSCVSLIAGPHPSVSAVWLYPIIAINVITVVGHVVRTIRRQLSVRLPLANKACPHARPTLLLQSWRLTQARQAALPRRQAGPCKLTNGWADFFLTS